MFPARFSTYYETIGGGGGGIRTATCPERTWNEREHDVDVATRHRLERHVVAAQHAQPGVVELEVARRKHVHVLH